MLQKRILGYKTPQVEKKGIQSVKERQKEKKVARYFFMECLRFFEGDTFVCSVPQLSLSNLYSFVLDFSSKATQSAIRMCFFTFSLVRRNAHGFKHLSFFRICPHLPNSRLGPGCSAVLMVTGSYLELAVTILSAAG
jgi:hypothetical protein